ncbi:fluoride efflux transporter CrcB [Streptomyces rubradiris]|uniref:Fluoride-specific ion channel FluC n=1 Tax=Streptomyces rubradiris TaxID=285531 RepID=A0ABQ3R3Z6_STRRR|nr:fluoride efflux transporter CrcB [Streptomyces rubradiris]GHH05292.1 putative fluoride ion transporter CrcB 1 [Streptomyces rubradiris]GHI50584.1 putative fluoride ion transporter CrcB 1 [Streptomyces rubradiris]
MTAPETRTRGVRPASPRRSEWRAQAPVVAVVAAGGALGATARHALTLAWPTPPGGFPWATFWTNVSGCAAMGVLMVLVTDVWAAHRLLRPFLGTGVLGGYTTFSTYAVDIRSLTDAGRPGPALAYLAATLCAALAAVWLASAAARRIFAGRQR